MKRVLTDDGALYTAEPDDVWERMPKLSGHKERYFGAGWKGHRPGEARRLKAKAARKARRKNR